MSSDTPSPHPAAPPAPPAPPAPVPPTLVDPFARAGSEVLGGPAGRRLGGDGPWWARALPVSVALASLVVALGALAKHHYRAQGWHTPDQFVQAC